MLSISTCPKCQRLVSLPANVDATILVRCPFCQAEYAMGETIPPELIPVEKQTVEPLGWTKEMIGAADAIQESRLEEQENEAAEVVERISIGMAHLHKRKTKAWWRAPLEVVFGGLAGLLIAYYGLALCLGPELKNRGFPVVSYLPGITWLTAPPEKPDRVKVKPTDVEGQGAKK